MPTTTITDVRTVAVPVTDQNQAVDFYVDKLGFEKRMDAEFQPGMRWIEVAPPDAAVSIALPPVQGGTSGTDTGIRLATTSAQTEHAALAARGVDVDELLLWPGVPPMFSFRDPDGNTLYVVETSG